MIVYVFLSGVLGIGYDVTYVCMYMHVCACTHSPTVRTYGSSICQSLEPATAHGTAKEDGFFDWCVAG